MSNNGLDRDISAQAIVPHPSPTIRRISDRSDCYCFEASRFFLRSSARFVRSSSGVISLVNPAAACLSSVASNSKQARVVDTAKIAIIHFPCPSFRTIGSNVGADKIRLNLPHSVELRTTRRRRKRALLPLLNTLLYSSPRLFLSPSAFAQRLKQLWARSGDIELFSLSITTPQNHR